MKLRLASILAAICIGISACATDGPASPGTAASGVPSNPSNGVSNKVLAASYTGVQTVAQSALALAQAGKISKVDVENVLAMCNAVVAGLDAVSQMNVTDPVGASARLQQVSIVLVSLQTYLATRKG